jgi:transposase-like protein
MRVTHEDGRKPKHGFLTLRLTLEEKAGIADIAQAHDVSTSHILRTLIRQAISERPRNRKQAPAPKPAAKRTAHTTAAVAKPVIRSRSATAPRVRVRVRSEG